MLRVVPQFGAELSDTKADVVLRLKRVAYKAKGLVQCGPELKEPSEWSTWQRHTYSLTHSLAYTDTRTHIEPSLFPDVGILAM